MYREDLENVYLSFKKQDLSSEKKEKRSKMLKRILMVFLFIFVFLLGAFVAIFIENNKFEKSQINSTETFDEIETILKEYWLYSDTYEDIGNELMNRAFYGMTAFEEDPYTTYMSKEEMEKFASSINMNFVGVGIQYMTVDGYPLVNTVFHNSPAYKAGIKAGDIITHADGTSLSGLNSDDVRKMVIGEKGTEVVLTIIRGSDELEFRIIRDEVDTSVYCYSENDYIVAEIYSFGDNTAKELISYLDEYPDYKKIIIDLRGNGGGYQTAVAEIAGLFIGDKEIYLRQEDVYGNEQIAYTSCKKTYSFDDIVILTNSYTASASEVLTICLKESLDHVTIVGETTYGKGVIQSNYLLDNGGALKFTSYNWYSPNGVSIHNEGIKPDVEVKLADVAYESFNDLAEDETYEYDDVSVVVSSCQKALDFLGYNVSRTDGYFDESFLNALNQFKKANDLKEDGILDRETYKAIISISARDLRLDKTKDLQLQKAISLLSE